jgi:type VI secretion system protein ImpM
MTPAGGFGPGFFGKIPGRGDFVGQGLPRTVLDPWDRWLQAALGHSRRGIGREWDRLFAAAPAWRFVLVPGLCGDDGAAGVLVASTDSIGRLYPLVVAASLPPDIDPELLPFAAAGWFAGAEAMALDASQGRASPQDLAGGMAGLGRPVAGNGARFPSHRALLAEMLGPLPAAPSLWWSRGRGPVQPSILVCPGMPRPDGFTAMLDGDWRRWGWRDQEREDEDEDG